MTEGGDGEKRRWWARLWESLTQWAAVKGRRSRLAWSALWAFVGAGAFVFSPWLDAPWLVIVALGTVLALLPLFGPELQEPNRNKQGQFAPRLRRQWVDVAGAVLVAIAFEWVLFGLLADNWTWPWVQVHELNGSSDSLVQPAIALLTPVVALVTAVFAYRKSTIALAESQRADVAAFQQRFIDAARLLADSNASTRIAGATAMGSLARDWVDNRQECVNVLCGYLKVKPSPEHLDIIEEGDKVTYTWKAGEDAVRLEVVDQLRAIFTPGSNVPESPGPIDLKLPRAWFPPGTAFSGSQFTGTAVFDGATFTGTAEFDGATFTRAAEFDGATFTRAAEFDGATFTRAARFEGASFTRAARFRRAAFTGDALFDAATFSSSAAFGGATFCGDALFDAATFYDDAWFDGATFYGDAWFDGARFKGNARFKLATFTDTVSFERATFTERFGALGSRNSRERTALGPVTTGSKLPSPPGVVVKPNGTVLRPAEWVRDEG